ncbi:MAG: murein hydrolase activator EnvC family protein [Bacillota bacterium]
MRARPSKTKKYPLVCMAFLLLTAFPVVFPVEGASTDDLLRKKQEELSSAKNKENSAKTQLSTIATKLAKVEDNLAGLNWSIKKSQKNANILKQKIRLDERSISSLSTEAARIQELLDKRLVSIYKYGFYSYLEALVGAENFSDFATRFELVGVALNQDLELLDKNKMQIRDIRLRKARVERQHRQLLLETARIEAIRKNTKIKEQELLKLRAEQQKLLEKYGSERRRIEKELLELEKEFERYVRNAEKEKLDTDALGTGSLTWPVYGRITSYFTLTRVHPVLRTVRPHRGVDIAAPKGASVKAADSGRVELAGWKGDYGYTVIIYHGNGYSTLYGHNSRLAVKAGEKVVKGETISYVGSTGMSTGPHLHFEVWRNGERVDPLPFLPKR